MKNRLADVRKEKKLTLKDLEKLTDIPLSSLSQFENGRRGVLNNRWVALSSTFDVPLGYLLGIDDRRYSIKLFDNLLHTIQENNLSPIEEIKSDLSIIGVVYSDFDNLEEQLTSFCIFCYKNNLKFKNNNTAYATFIAYLRTEILRYSIAEKFTAMNNQKAEIEKKYQGTEKENALAEINTYSNLISQKFIQAQEELNRLKKQT
jgi:transcriptional regulator with XRE-family HTH domain